MIEDLEEMWFKANSFYNIMPVLRFTNTINMQQCPTFAGSEVRRKREEKMLEGGCEAHRTAVALGALSQYARYLTEHLSQH